MLKFVCLFSLLQSWAIWVCLWSVCKELHLLLMGATHKAATGAEACGGHGHGPVVGSAGKGFQATYRWVSWFSQQSGWVLLSFVESPTLVPLFPAASLSFSQLLSYAKHLHILGRVRKKWASKAVLYILGKTGSPLIVLSLLCEKLWVQEHWVVLPWWRVDYVDRVKLVLLPLPMCLFSDLVFLQWCVRASLLDSQTSTEVHGSCQKSMLPWEHDGRKVLFCHHSAHLNFLTSMGAEPTLS
jgi:hypothetical protein